MPIELRIISGARAGQSDYFEKAVISIGRHPASDFLLDIKKDLDVSRRHGEIRFTGSGYKLYDKDSTNGTFLNDVQLDPGGNEELHDGDTIKFGAQGPVVSVVISGVGAGDAKGEKPVGEPHHTRRAFSERLAAAGNAPDREPAPPIPSASPVQPQAAGYTPSFMRTTVDEPAPDTDDDTATTDDAPRQPTTERVAIAVKQQTRALRIAVAAVVVVLGGFAATVFWIGRQQTATRDVEIQQLLAANEEITRRFQVRLQQMNDTALTNALQRRLDSLTAKAQEAHDDKTIAAAQQQLRANRELQRKFNEMDLPAVRDANDPAVALIVSEIDGKQKEATGFNVTAGGLLVTNRHVVTDSTNARATKILVKFANTREWRHAHLAKLDDDPNVDLALVQLDEPGSYPAVPGIARTMDARVGEPIATLGYPLGTDIPMDGSGTDFAAKTSLTIGTVSKAVSDLLQIDAFASHGSSGSPVVDSHGHVIGVVWGGPPNSGGRIVYAVPADRIAALIASVR